MSATVLIVALVALAVGAVLGLLAGRAGSGASEDRFKVLANEALRANNEQFLQVAEQQLGRFHDGAAADLATKEQAVQQLVAPVAEQLGTLQQRLGELDVERGKVNVRLDALATTTKGLFGETSKLATALRDVRVRGNWGELQLRKVVELAGMEAYCDFDEQVVVPDGTTTGRPDMVVRLPRSRAVVVDSKVPLGKYLEAVEAEDPAARAAGMKLHARALEQHVSALASRNYPQRVDGSLDLVVLFVPGEAILYEALDADPTLFEKAIRQSVFLTSPGNLVALLKSVAYGWREDRLAENAEEIRRLGAELHERVTLVAGKLDMVGKRIGATANAFNDVVGSFESRLVVTTRRLEELGASSGKDLVSPSSIAPAVRPVLAVADRESTPELGAAGTERGEGQ